MGANSQLNIELCTFGLSLIFFVALAYAYINKDFFPTVV